MSIIDDKEVGKFWKLVHETKDYPILYEIAVPLIRKLVAERAASYAGEEPTLPSDTQEALNDFGIDLADWKDDD